MTSVDPRVEAAAEAMYHVLRPLGQPWTDIFEHSRIYWRRIASVALAAADRLAQDSGENATIEWGVAYEGRFLDCGNESEARGWVQQLPERVTTYLVRRLVTHGPWLPVVAPVEWLAGEQP